MTAAVIVLVLLTVLVATDTDSHEAGAPADEMGKATGVNSRPPPPSAENQIRRHAESAKTFPANDPFPKETPL